MHVTALEWPYNYPINSKLSVSKIPITDSFVPYAKRQFISVKHVGVCPFKSNSYTYC